MKTPKKTEKTVKFADDLILELHVHAYHNYIPKNSEKVNMIKKSLKVNEVKQL